MPTLFRPVGLNELSLIGDSGMSEFPPCLPQAKLLSTRDSIAAGETSTPALDSMFGIRAQFFGSEPAACPEIPPWSLRSVPLRQIPTLQTPTHSERIADTAPSSGDGLPCPGTACNQCAPDAAELHPASRYGSWSLQTAHLLVRRSRRAHSADQKA
jgi:hypothetical protein